MDVKYLLRDELVYELQIRSISVNATLLEKRKILRLLMKQEEDLCLPVGKPCQYNFKTELSTCQKKLEKLKIEIQFFNSVNLHKKFKRITSRLCHFENRLRRITPQNRNADQKLQKLKQLCMVSLEMVQNAYETEKLSLTYLIEEDIGNAMEAGPSNAPDSNPLSIYPSTSSQMEVESNKVVGVLEEPSSSKTNIASRFSHIHNTTIVSDLPPAYSKTGRFYMQCWGICYDGTTDVHDFQNVIEYLRRMDNVSKEQLFAFASSLFKGDALLWYQSRKYNLHNWDNLIVEIGRSFSTLYDDQRLWNYINIRYQRHNEKVIFYVTSIEHLLQRLTQVPTEEERVNVIRRNLLGPVKNALIAQEINTVDQLLRIGRTVELRYWSQNEYRL